MDVQARIERALERAVTSATGDQAPPKLAEALRYSVFPGGARVRPRLVLAVALACGDDRPALSDAAAAAIELMHCASLVHDDLPLFDDADLRRGRPSVHKAFSEPLALLAGDALIVLAFETLTRRFADAPERIAALQMILTQGVGMPGGLTAGQAWESEPEIDLQTYHRAKTGALFIAATAMGAAAAGADPAAWRPLGERLGDAYQVADDLRDLCASSEDLGKPAGQDRAHGRPSAATELGPQAALARMKGLIGEAVSAIPDCPGAQALTALVEGEAKRLAPKNLARSAA